MLKMYGAYLKAWFGRKEGQGMVEYGLIIGLVAVLLIGGLTLMKDQLVTTFTAITNALKPPTP